MAHKRLQMDSKHIVGWKKWSETNVVKCSDLTKLVVEIAISLYTFICTREIFHNFFLTYVLVLEELPNGFT